MIPHDHILIDGDTALVVVAPDSVPGGLPTWIDRDFPCYTCDGAGSVLGLRCRWCDGTGRHKFDIDVEADHPLIDLPGATETLRVHVSDEMPIVEEDENAQRRTDAIVLDLLGQFWYDGNRMTLPSAAKVGMWLVRLAVHS